MKRIHIHIAVDDLEESTTFYAALFGQVPTMTKPDYVKWSLDDPQVNLSITQCGVKPSGIDHLGIQVDSGSELAALHDSLSKANISSQAETAANCCYAQSDKQWTKDPQNIVWELFHSHGRTDVYGNDHGPTGHLGLMPSKASDSTACCG